VPRALDYPTINLNLRQSALHGHNACLSQMDGWIDRWINIMALAQRFVLMNASHAKNASYRTGT